MSITVNLRKEKMELVEKSITADELLRRLDLSPQAYLVVKDKGLMTGREIIRDGEEVHIIAVISGGCRN